MKRIQLFILITSLLFSLSALGQELVVKGMKLDASDLSAGTYVRKDLNEKTCALVKVLLPIENAVFEGNVIGGVENKSGEYWVYMSEGSKELRVKHPNYLRLHVNFLDYGIEQSGVKGKCTYTLTLVPYISSYMLNDQKGQHTQPVQAEKRQVPAEQMNPIDASNNHVETFTVNGVSFNMVLVEGGTFMMGATSEQESEANTNEKPVHQVTLSSFYMGETEVTQQLWRAVMGKNWMTGKRKFNYKGPQRPVDSASSYDCERFLSQLNAITGCNFRLPTEAEWEYAARGGQKSRGYKYSGSDNIDEVAWYYNNSSDKTHDVKTKKPNELGLYDMSGNVEELCQDYYSDYSESPQTEPTGPVIADKDKTNKEKNLLRGGCLNSYPQGCRNSRRYAQMPNLVSSNQGLRIVLKK